jgi:hypothetical protein
MLVDGNRKARAAGAVIDVEGRARTLCKLFAYVPLFLLQIGEVQAFLSPPWFLVPPCKAFEA